MRNVVVADEIEFRKLKPTLQEYIEETVDEVLFGQIEEIDFQSKNRYYLFYSDHMIKKILQLNFDKDIHIGFLPHPQSVQASSGFKVPKDVKMALHELMQKDHSGPVDKKMLHFDETVILNYAVLGEISSFVSSKKGDTSWFGRIPTFFRFLKKLKDLRHKPLTLVFDDKDPVDTCATDLLIVQHAQNASVSRLLSGKKEMNNELFNTFVFAPRSVIDLFKAYVIKLLLGATQKNKEFDFLSRFVSGTCTLSSTDDLNFRIDGKKVVARNLRFGIKGAFKLLPSKELSLEYTGERQAVSKLYQSKRLPKGEIKRELSRKKISFISHASTEEYKELFRQLRENARPSQNYIVLMTLSSILATLGVFADSSPVIIGAMILAPLMGPIISLSMGVLRQDRDLIRGSVITVLSGMVVAYAFAMALTFITPINNMNNEITSRIKPNIIDLGIAVISGAAGAYAYSKESIAKTLAGVAIAVALVPPLAVSGIGLAWGEWSVFFGALLLLLTNLTGMVLAASLTFLFTGYSPFHLARKGLLISFFVVLSISIPLGYGFFKVVKENQIIQSLNRRTIEDAYLDQVRLERYSPTEISLDITMSDYPSEEKLTVLKDKIEQIVGHDVTLNIGIRLKR